MQKRIEQVAPVPFGSKPVPAPGGKVNKDKDVQQRQEETHPGRKAAADQHADLAAEEESAAAHDEPMGSIAAAVPGSDAVAQQAKDSKKLPGAEASQIRDRPKTTAGTEEKLDRQGAA